MVEEPRLAQAGLAGEQDHRRTAVTGDAPPLRAQEGELVVAADERQPLGSGDRHLVGTEGHSLEDGNGIALALEQNGLALAEPDPARQLGREGADEDLATAGRLLQAGGHVHGVPDHGDVAVATDGRGHHLTGVDADREGQIAAELAHGEGGSHGPLGVVVVGLRHAEHRHERVADVLVDRPAVRLDHLGHTPEGGVDSAGDGFGIGALGE